MVDDVDSIDDFLLPQKPTTVRAFGKFRPKAQSKTNKELSISSSTSSVAHANASNLDSSCKANVHAEDSCLPSSSIVDSCDTTVSHDYISQNTGTLKGIASETFAPTDNNLNSDEQDKVCVAKLDPSPSELHNEDPLVPEGSKISDERSVVFQSDDSAMLIPSACEYIVDIFHSDAGKKSVKFQPKSLSQSNKDKARKSVSFNLPCFSDNTTTSPLGMDTSEMKVTTDIYTENILQSSLTTSDLTDNCQINHQNPTAEDVIDQSSFEGFSNTSSQPSLVPGKFQPKHGARTGDIRDLESSGSLYALEVGSPKQNSLVKDTGYGDNNASDILNDSDLRELQFTNIDHYDKLENLPETSDFQYAFDERDSEQDSGKISRQDVDEEMPSPNVEDLHQRSEEVPIPKTIEDVGASGSHMKLRKRVNRQGTRSTEEKNKDDLTVEDNNISRMDDDESNREYRTDFAKKKTTQNITKKAKSGSEKMEKQKGKVSRKNKITEEGPEKKKFPHSTKRKRRQVDKVLLETPECEIDFKQIAIKDLIMLGEAKERMLNKEASTTTNSFTNERRNKEADYDDDEENPAVVESAKYFNYGSYSNRVKAPRWSKTETELLYKAIRQFGTDFAMIQQLFPHRTRHQVKMKFKNEERKHPMLVHDALCHRSNDLSHLKQVIEKLQANKEQTTEQDEGDDPSTTVFEEAIGAEEERVEIQKDDDVIDGNDQGDEVNSPEHSGDVEYEAESPTDFDEYQSAWD